MSGKLGPMKYGGGEQEIFLGRDFTQHRDISEDTARVIDGEVHAIVMANYERAKRIILEKRAELVSIAESLLVRESLDGNDVAILMKGGILPPKPEGTTPTATATASDHSAEGGQLDPALNPA